MDRLRPTQTAGWHRSLYTRTALQSAIATVIALAIANFSAYISLHATGYGTAPTEIWSPSSGFALPTFLYIWLSFIGVAAQSRRQSAPFPRLTRYQS